MTDNSTNASDIEIKSEQLDRAGILTGVDDELISEAIASPRTRRLPWLAAAAAAVVAAAAALILPRLIGKPAGEQTVSVPTPEPAGFFMPTENAEATAAPTEYAGVTVSPTEAPAPTEEAPTPTAEPPAPTGEAPTNTPGATQKTTPQPTQKTTPQPTAATTAAPTAEPTDGPGPEPYIDTKYFGSFEELEAAAAAGGHDSPGDALYGLTEYFVPNKLPEGAKLKRIAVTPYSVSVIYDCEGIMQLEEGEECRFILEWRRNWLQGSAENWAIQSARAIGAEAHEYEGIWIFDTPYCGNERRAIWEKDGRGFILYFPGCYTEDEEAEAFTDLTRVELS